MTNEFANPVTPSNTPRPARRRRDPDEDTTAPQTAAVADTPPTAAPTTPPPAAPQPTAPQPSNGLAATNPTGGTLDHVLTPNTTGPGHHGTSQTTDSVHVLAGLARMRLAPVDPYKDYVSDSTRQLRWVAMAIAQIANLTGRTRQDIVTRALLGIEPLPADVLDANWLAVYGYPRDQHQPHQ